MAEDEKNEYGKQSKGKLVAIYIVIAIVVYGAIYYFFIAKKGGFSAVMQQTSQLTPATSAAPATTAENPIQISNFSFSPSSLTVKAGDTVTWTNADSVGHSATADDKSFDTGIIDTGKSGTATFTKAGTFTYHCSVHPSMKGTIIVQAATDTSATSAPILTPAPTTGGAQIPGY
jgi:plastocyanin